MQEYVPKKRQKVLTKDFLARNTYILVLALLLLGGITYGYTFLVHNEKISTGSITTASLTINFSDRSISASNLSVPSSDSEGMAEYTKSLTISNATDIDGIVNLSLTRTSGLALTDLRYAIVVNGAIQEIADVPADGKIFETAIMGGSPTGETLNVEVRLWPKSSYSGNTTTFVGSIAAEIKYLGGVASELSSPAGKYVKFNCNGSVCETWQIVKVENDRLVLTRQADYTNATSRTNSNRFNPNSFNPALTFYDDSLIYSLSTDGKNVYLAKTVRISNGLGTLTEPYELENVVYREGDKKVQAVITYKEGSTTLGTQNIYYGETNYISRDAQAGWSDGTNRYVFGDTVSFTTDTILSVLQVQAVNLSFDNTTTSFSCTDAQCALQTLDNIVDPTAAKTISLIPTLEETPYGKIYTGSNPSNYVWFNNEQWRIIGVYGDKLKIVKAEPLASTMVYSSNSSNTWAGSYLETYLNQNTSGGYYYGLSQDAKDMIVTGTWYDGKSSSSLAAGAIYEDAITSTLNRNVGLITAYEFLYGAPNNGTCWTTVGSSYSSCATSDWLNFSTDPVWTMTGDKEHSGAALFTVSNMLIFAGVNNNGSNPNSFKVYPAVYLNANVVLTGGTGASGQTNSYKLALNS